MKYLLKNKLHLKKVKSILLKLHYYKLRLNNYERDLNLGRALKRLMTIEDIVKLTDNNV